MGRRAHFDTTARRMMDGSCIRNAEFARESADGTWEYTSMRNGRFSALEVIKPTKAPVTVSQADQHNNLQYHGDIMVDGLPVPFYGSQASWLKLKAQG